MIEWIKTKAFDRIDGINEWKGNGENFDFVIRQYENGFVVCIRITKIRGDGIRTSRDKWIGQFKTADQAQRHSEWYDENQAAEPL